MRKFVAMLALLMLAGCGGSDEPAEPAEEMKIDRALCRDLDDGLTLMNLKPEDMEPAAFAVAVDRATANECPEWRDDTAVKALLENWGLSTGS